MSPLYRWLALAIVTAGTFTVLLDTTVNVALPAITEALQAPIPAIQWVIIAYVLATTSLLMGLGRLTDLIGRRRIWTWGLIALAAALILNSLAQNVGQLVAFRILQAIGATMIYAAGPAIITEAFPSSQRGRAIGIMTMGGQLGMAAGPILGGWLVATYGWPAIFAGRAPLALAIGALSFLTIRDLQTRRTGERFDFGGAATLGLAMVALLLGLNQATTGDAPAPLPLALFAGAAGLFALFVWWEGRNKAPMVDLALFRNRLFAIANLTNLLSNLTMFGIWLLVPYYLVQGLGFEPVTAGLFLSIVPAVTSLIAPFSGWLSDRIGSWSPSLVGLSIQAAALFVIARLDGTSPPGQVAASLFLLGLGLGLFLAPNNSFIMGSVPRDQLGIAGGMMTTMRSLGVVLGVALLSAVYAARVPVHQPGATATAVGAEATFVIPAFQDAFTFAGCLCLFAVALALVRGKSPLRPD